MGSLISVLRVPLHSDVLSGAVLTGPIHLLSQAALSRSINPELQDAESLAHIMVEQGGGLRPDEGLGSVTCTTPLCSSVLHIPLVIIFNKRQDEGRLVS